MILLRLVLSWFYFRHANTGWCLFTTAPHILNVAMPDLNVDYVVASFYRNEDVVIYGRTPQSSYSSMTTYDTLGKVCSHVRLPPNKAFRLKIGDDLKRPDTYFFIIIYRIYDPVGKYKLPTIIHNGQATPERTLQQLKQNTERIGNIINISFRSFLHLRIDPGRKFFHPKQIPDSMFVNPDASYMVASPSSGGVIRVDGVPPDCNTIVGFMACNLSTTGTDSSIHWMKRRRRYTIYVAYDEKSAVQYGWNKKYPLLLWSKENKNPVLVYRLVHNKEDNIELETPECTIFE